MKNLDRNRLNTEVVAVSVLQLGVNTAAINGVRGKGNFRSKGARPSSLTYVVRRKIQND